MCKKILFSAAVLSIFLACNAQGEVTYSTWVGGEFGYWDEPYNWDPPIVPGANFVVAIDSNKVGVDEVEVIMLGNNYTIYSLNCYGVVYLDQWYVGTTFLRLDDPNGLTNYGNLELGEDFEIYGNIINISGARLELEDMDITDGNLINQSDAMIDIQYKVGVEEGSVENAGLMQLTPADGEIYINTYFHNTGRFIIYGGKCGVDEGIFDNDMEGKIHGFGIIYADESFRNKGQVIASGGSLVLLSEGSVTNTGTLANKALSTLNIQPAADVNNQGTIEVNAGGGVAFDCNMVNETSAVIRLLGGTLAATKITQKADANFAGFGGITGDVVIDTDGIIKLTGPTNVVGDVEIKKDATLQVSDGLTLITGQTTCNGTIHIKGGYLIPQGGLSGNCNVIWEPGLYTNVADFNLDGQVNLKDFAYFADVWLWQTAWR